MARLSWRACKRLLGWRIPAPSGVAPRLRLPWWGLVLHSRDKAALEALIASSDRLHALMLQPGWQDVQAVIQDWLERYRDQAGHLGQRVKDEGGQWVLSEEDTPADDRRRLIACAQAAALSGLRQEIYQRAGVRQILERRDATEQQQAEVSHELV